MLIFDNVDEVMFMSMDCNESSITWQSASVNPQIMSSKTVPEIDSDGVGEFYANINNGNDKTHSVTVSH